MDSSGGTKQGASHSGPTNQIQAMFSQSVLQNSLCTRMHHKLLLNEHEEGRKQNAFKCHCHRLHPISDQVALVHTVVSESQKAGEGIQISVAL